jgi:hypothetical protein
MPESPEESSADWSETAQRPRLNYETDLVKHFVRMRGWLPASKERKNALGPRGRRLRYFTFCAASAVDVFMLEREEIIKRNDDGVLEQTFYCEKDPPAFRAIGDLLQSTGNGFLGRFEEIILFEDSGETVGRTYTDPGPGKVSQGLLTQLELKDKHDRLKGAFPFDIINLDATGALIPPNEPPPSKLIKAIARVLEWQRDMRLSDGRQLDEFTMFLTTRVVREEMSSEGVEQLIQIVDANLQQRSGLRQLWQERVGNITAVQLAETDFHRFFTKAVPKWLVEIGRERQWDVSSEGRFLYWRETYDPPFAMMCEVLTFSRVQPGELEAIFDPEKGLATISSTAKIEDRISDVVLREAVWADAEVRDRSMAQRVQKDLSSVLEYKLQVCGDWGIAAVS